MVTVALRSFQERRHAGRVAYLKGPCDMSFSAMREFFRDVTQVPIRREQLAKLVQKVSASLEPAYTDGNSASSLRAQV